VDIGRLGTRACPAKRRNTSGAFGADGTELRRLIREGFERGIAGEQIAQAAGLSMSRVSQIRDGRR
jgi:hypothetical protein